MENLDAASQGNRHKIIEISWRQVFSRCNELARVLTDKDANIKTVYGVPRGGLIPAAIIAALIDGYVTDNPALADIFVDDIVDSGATMFRLLQKYNKPFYPLYRSQDFDGWLEFPWEKANGEQPAEDAVIRLLQLIGEDLEREGIKDTPSRVIKAYREFFSPAEPKITVFSAEGYDQLIVDRNIPFYSYCEHHMMPFFGTVQIGYIPDEKIIGLSKLARITEYFARRLNTQEYLTQNIANYLQEKLHPKGLGVIIKARHLCKEMRGVRTTGEMVTSALLGVFLTNEQTKNEFLNLK